MTGSVSKSTPKQGATAKTAPPRGLAGPNPYVGPRPFEPGETLYGREHEISDLYYLWNAERIVVLHSPSGAGKSSLIQAGLLPRIQGSFDVWGPTRVNQEPAVAGANRFVLSALRGFEEGVPERLRRSPQELAEQSLAQYLEKRPRRRSAPKNIALLFDQFEEILTVDPLAEEAKHTFFDQLGTLLHNPRVWALFVLREDYLAPLDPYARQVPTHLKNRFRIDLLSLRGARQAILEPAVHGGRTFPSVDHLLHDLATVKVQQIDGAFVEETGRHIEPVQLQVVCLRLWNAMPDDDLSIDSEDLQRFGDVTRALADYYADSVQRIAQGDFASQRAIREWFSEALITPGGIRGQVLKSQEHSAGLANHLIEQLLNTHLVRSEQRAGATWFELAHDRLIDPVRHDNAEWRDQHLSDLQRSSTVWERQGRPVALTLQGDRLADAESWAEKHQAELSSIETQFLDASRQAHNAIEKERRLVELERDHAQSMKIRRLAYFSTFLAVTAVIVSFIATHFWWEAEQQEQEAEDLSKRLAISNFLDTDPTYSKLILLEELGPDPAPADIEMLYRTLPTRLWVSLDGHEDAITSASFSPDSSRLVTTSWDDTARLWNPMTGESLVTLEGHSENVRTASFSPDGSLIVTASRDGTARLWDADTGRQLRVLDKHLGPVIDATFSSDGSLLATCSVDNSARLWNVQSGTWIRDFSGHRAEVETVAFSQDDRLVLTASRDQTAIIWDTSTGNRVTQLHGSPSTKAFTNTFARADAEPPQENLSWDVRAQFSHDSRQVLTSHEGAAYVWDTSTGAKISTYLPTGERSITQAIFSPNSSLVATVSEHVVDIRRASSGEKIHSLLHETPVTDATFSPDGSHLVSFASNLAHLWSTTTGEHVAVLKGHTRTLWGASFNPDGSLLVTTSVNGRARIWNTETKTIQGDKASFGPDSSRLLVQSEGRAHLWEPVFRHPLATLDTRPSRLLAATFGPDDSAVSTLSEGTPDRSSDFELEFEFEQETIPLENQTSSTSTAASPMDAITHSALIVGATERFDDPNTSGLEARFGPGGLQALTFGPDNTATLWTPDTDQFFVLEGHTDRILEAAFSPTGALVGTASLDRTIRVWDSKTGQEVYILKGQAHRIISLAFNSDDSHLVTTSYDNKARIWNLKTGQPTQTLTEHWNALHTAVFNREGTRVVTTSRDHLARIWDVENGQMVLAFDGHKAPVYDASFSPDGKRVLTASGDRSAILWDAATGSVYAHFKGHGKIVRRVSFSPDGSLLLTSSDDNTTRIWPNDTELLLSMNRAGTYECLDADFRTQYLNEEDSSASIAQQACETCVPFFFEDLLPAAGKQTYIKAWRNYQECLMRESQ